MFSRLPLLAVFAGVVLTGAVGAVIGLMVVFGGLYDVSAIIPHSRLVSWAFHTTMIHSVRRRADHAPLQLSPEQAREGFAVYEDHCAMCHGGPGVSRARWVMGLEPTPPYLIDAARHWSAQDMRFIIGNGVKMTAMPAWKLSLTSEQITNVVAFLEELPDMSAAQYAHLHQEKAAQKQSLARINP